MKCGAFSWARVSVKLLFEILCACDGRGEQAQGGDWPTKQSLYFNPILCPLKKSVCSLGYKFAVPPRRVLFARATRAYPSFNPQLSSNCFPLVSRVEALERESGQDSSKFYG